jgi:SAM-dependent methyltransferase
MSQQRILSSGFRSALAAPLRGLVRSLFRTRVGTVLWQQLKRWVEGDWLVEADRRLFFLYQNSTPEEWRTLAQAWDDRTPLPAEAAQRLRADHPRLLELRQAYAPYLARFGLPWQWEAGRLDNELNLRYFRGESPYVWQYRDLPRVSRLKFYIAAQYVRSRDTHGLLARLGDEDGAFGCWRYAYPGFGAVSRDLLDAANELLFLERNMGLLTRPDLRVLDIGAGYGRLAHRMAQAVPGLRDYCCVDAIPESSFLAEYYLAWRGVAPPARVLPLPDFDTQEFESRFDLIVNVHSFSECTYAALEYWFGRIAQLQAPYLFIVPNDPEAFLSTEGDGSRRDFRPLIEAAGYTQAASEPVYADAAVRELMGIEDRFYLFRHHSAPLPKL